VAEDVVGADPGNVAWQLDLVTSLYQASTLLDPAKARSMLHRAIAILDSLAQANKLTAAQGNWPQLFRNVLAGLPPQ
jgi:hypothetical protein